MIEGSSARTREGSRSLSLSVCLDLQVSAALPPVECMTLLGPGEASASGAGFWLEDCPSLNSYRTRRGSDSVPVFDVSLL